MSESGMDASEQDALAGIRAALQDPNVSLHIVQTMSHGRGVQVKIKSRKIGPLLFPTEGKGPGSVLVMLGWMLDTNDETTKNENED